LDTACHFSCKHWFFAAYFPVSGSSDEKELQMMKILTEYGVCALAVALMVPLAQAQSVGIQASQRCRNAFDVFNLIVKDSK
jgi:hypothetical protein